MWYKLRPFGPVWTPTRAAGGKKGTVPWGSSGVEFPEGARGGWRRWGRPHGLPARDSNLVQGAFLRSKCGVHCTKTPSKCGSNCGVQCGPAAGRLRPHCSSRLAADLRANCASKCGQVAGANCAMPQRVCAPPTFNEIAVSLAGWLEGRPSAGCLCSVGVRLTALTTCLRPRRLII